MTNNKFATAAIAAAALIASDPAASAKMAARQERQNARGGLHGRRNET